MENKKDLTVEALIQKAKEKNLKITVEDAEKILHSLSDSELDKVTGGALHSVMENSGETCPHCHNDVVIQCSGNVYYCYICDDYFEIENHDPSSENGLGLRPYSGNKEKILY